MTTNVLYKTPRGMKRVINKLRIATMRALRYEMTDYRLSNGAKQALNDMDYALYLEIMDRFERGVRR